MFQGLFQSAIVSSSGMLLKLKTLGLPSSARDGNCPGLYLLLLSEYFGAPLQTLMITIRDRRAYILIQCSCVLCEWFHLTWLTLLYVGEVKINLLVLFVVCVHCLFDRRSIIFVKSSK